MTSLLVYLSSRWRRSFSYHREKCRCLKTKLFTWMTYTRIHRNVHYFRTKWLVIISIQQRPQTHIEKKIIVFHNHIIFHVHLTISQHNKYLFTYWRLVYMQSLKSKNWFQNKNHLQHDTFIQPGDNEWIH